MFLRARAQVPSIVRNLILAGGSAEQRAIVIVSELECENMRERLGDDGEGARVVFRTGSPTSQMCVRPRLVNDQTPHHSSLPIARVPWCDALCRLLLLALRSDLDNVNITEAHSTILVCDDEHRDLADTHSLL